MKTLQQHLVPASVTEVVGDDDGLRGAVHLQLFRRTEPSHLLLLQLEMWHHPAV